MSVGRLIFGGTDRLSLLSHSIYKSLSNVSLSAPRKTFQVWEVFFV